MNSLSPSCMNMNRFESHISEIKRKQFFTGMEPLERYLIDSNEIMVPIMMPSRSSAAPSISKISKEKIEISKKRKWINFWKLGFSRRLVRFNSGFF